MRCNLTAVNFENGPCGKRRSPFSHACLLSSLLPEGKGSELRRNGSSPLGIFLGEGGEGEFDNNISVATLGEGYGRVKFKFMRGGTWRRGGLLSSRKVGASSMCWKERERKGLVVGCT